MLGWRLCGRAFGWTVLFPDFRVCFPELTSSNRMTDCLPLWISLSWNWSRADVSVPCGGASSWQICCRSLRCAEGGSESCRLLGTISAFDIGMGDVSGLRRFCLLPGLRKLFITSIWCSRRWWRLFHVVGVDAALRCAFKWAHVKRSFQCFLLFGPGGIAVWYR